MLKVKFSKITNYAAKDERIYRKAWEDFFQDADVYPQMEGFDDLVALFNEWFIFDFKLDSGTTPVIEYFLKNPDNLSQEAMAEFSQIVKTQHFEMLELVDLKRGEWMKAYGMFGGKTYKIYEVSGSLTCPDYGTFWGRLAKIDNRWQLVGSNPLFLPTISTPRLKKVFLKDKKKPSPQDVLRFFLSDKKEPEHEWVNLTTKQIKNKRKKLEKQFNKLAQINNLKTAFKEIVDFVYEENYKTNFADFFNDLTKLKIPQELVIKRAELFNDVWNFFPHKTLKGKCPAEVYQERYVDRI